MNMNKWRSITFSSKRIKIAYDNRNVSMTTIFQAF